MAFKNMVHNSFLCKHEKKEFKPKQKIGIIGAGAAGLYSALLLENIKRTNNTFKDLDIKILEASDRVGGRIYTYNFATNKNDKYEYSDMGAMRLPTNNAPVYDLIDYLNQQIDIIPSEKREKLGLDKIELTQYFLSSIHAYDKYKLPNGPTCTLNKDKIFFQRDKEWFFLQSDLQTDFKKNPKWTDDQKKLMEEVKLVGSLMGNINAALEKKFIDALALTVEGCKHELHLFREKFHGNTSDDKFNNLIKQYGKYTVWNFITDQELVDTLNEPNEKKYIALTKHQAEVYETYYGNSSYLHKNLIDYLLDDINFEVTLMKDTIWGRGPVLIDGDQYQMMTIKGGLSRLPETMKGVLEAHNQDMIHFNKKVVKIESINGKTKVHYKTHDDHDPRIQEKTSVEEFDTVIVCIPNPAATNIDWKFTESFQKQLDAFRVLSSFPLFKMGLHFSYRFWEDQKNLIDNYAVIGGQCQSDLPSRWFVYPAYGYENGPDSKGTLLVYNWDNDAARWSGMDDNDRIDRVLDDLQIMYSKLSKDKNFNVRKYYLGHKSQPWPATISTGLAYFDETQYNTLRHLVTGFDNVYFAGEYLSPHHGWIVGAMQAAAQAVSLISGNHCQQFLFPDLKKYSDKQIIKAGPYKDQNPKPIFIENLDYDIGDY